MADGEETLSSQEFERKRTEAHEQGIDLDYKELPDGKFMILRSRKVPDFHKRSINPTDNLNTK